MINSDYSLHRRRHAATSTAPISSCRSTACRLSLPQSAASGHPATASLRCWTPTRTTELALRWTRRSTITSNELLLAAADTTCAGRTGMKQEFKANAEKLQKCVEYYSARNRDGASLAARILGFDLTSLTIDVQLPRPRRSMRSTTGCYRSRT